MAIVCEGYPDVQVSKENFDDIQQAVGGLVDGLPEEGFTPRFIDMYWTKGAAVVVCQDKETRDWLASSIPTLRAWEGSKLKMVGLEALPTYRGVLAWLPGPAEEMRRYLREVVIPHLVRIFRACLATGYVPAIWRQVKVVFIPKPSKNAYSGPRDYRPISLTSFLLKTLEGLVDRYLRDEALAMVPLHSNQHAYQA
jgi:hypothetical protein